MMNEYMPVEVGSTIRVTREMAEQVKQWTRDHSYDPDCPFCRIADSQRAEVGLRRRKVGDKR